MQNGRAPVRFVSFTKESSGWFAKHLAKGGWSAEFENGYEENTLSQKEQLPDFDLCLKSMIFGTDGIQIFNYETCEYSYTGLCLSSVTLISCFRFYGSFA